MKIMNFIIILSINRFMIELIAVMSDDSNKFYYIFKEEKIMLLIKILKL